MEIARNRNIRILMISGRNDGAKKSLFAVKSDLERNVMLLEDFGGGKPWNPRIVVQQEDEETDVPEDIRKTPGLSKRAKALLQRLGGAKVATRKVRKKTGGRWTQHQLYVDRDRIAKDPTVEALGVYGNITGGRFDLIIIDDPDNDQDTRNQTQRDRKWKWLNETVLELLEPDGMAMIIMTRKHADDTGGRAIASPLWDVIHDKAVIKWPGGIPAFARGEDGVERPVEPDRTKWVAQTEVTDSGRHVIREIQCEPGAEVLWPEKWPIELLLRDKFLDNWIASLREQQQFVIDDGSAQIRREWLEAARDPSISFAEDIDEPWLKQRGIDLIVQAWDPALLDDKREADEKDSDFTVGFTVGIDTRTWTRYVLRAYRARGLTPGALRGAVKAEAARFRPLYVGFESNAFGRLHTIELKRGTDLPIVPHTTTSTKKTDAAEGLPRIATLFENGKYVLPYGDAASKAFVDVFVNEAHGYGTEAHDDTLLSLWILECVVGMYQAYCDRIIKRGKVPPHIAKRAAAEPAAATPAPKPAITTAALRRRR
jgi:phage terminase large subunit-like protein